MLRRFSWMAAALAAASAVGSACDDTEVVNPALTSGAGGGSVCGPKTGTGGGGGGRFGTIFTIVMENHDYNDIVGSPNAPFFNSLIAKYGLATNYKDSGVHPSLPNYLEMISGDPQYGGGLDFSPNQPGFFPKDAPNLGDQMETAGIAWRSYQESAPGPCVLEATGSRYSPKHDPFLYFSNLVVGPTSQCACRNVTEKELDADLASGGWQYMWITPDLVDDGHDPTDVVGNPIDAVASLKTSDGWAQQWVGKIMASDAYKRNGVIFIVWDEGEGHNGNDKDKVPMIIVSEKIVKPGYKSDKAYSHKSYLATVEDMMGLPRLDTVKSEPNMLEFFQ